MATTTTKGSKAGSTKGGSTNAVEGGNQVQLPASYSPRLLKKYRTEVVPALMKKFGYKSVMQCPRLVKICLNQGVKGATSDKKVVDEAVA